MRSASFLLTLALLSLSPLGVREARANLSGLTMLDVSELRDSERSALDRLLGKYPSACGKTHSLEVSLRTDARCRRSVFAARYLVKLFKLHLLPSEVEEHFEQRFSATVHKDIDIANTPVRGNASAPVVLVEFSDFQCPHCKKMQPILERVLDEYRGQVRLHFKNFPLSMHPDAAVAAAAAVAAGKQGKFWQFHDRLFGGDQEHMELPVLEKLARDLKLDFEKWKADLEVAKASVARDRSEGERLQIQATPTLFISGRHYRGPTNFDEIKDWIDEELSK